MNLKHAGHMPCSAFSCCAVDESGHDIVYVAPTPQNLSSATITRVLQLQSSAWYNLSAFFML